MSKILYKILQVRVYKWLINWNQIRCDSYTSANKEMNKNEIDPKEKFANNILWLEKYEKYMNAIDRLTDKLENI